MISLRHQLHLEGRDISNYKVRLLKTDGNGSNPLDFYYKDLKRFYSNWLFFVGKNGLPFQPDDFVIGLIKLNTKYDDAWLFVGCYEITGYNYKKRRYSYRKLKEYDGEENRLVIKYKNTNQRMVRRLDSIIDDLEVLKITNRDYSALRFDGFRNINLSFSELENIINRKPEDWYTALSSHKAIYLIKDSHNGKEYVGSATSHNGMLLSRWKNYAETYNGGNSEFKKLDDDYIRKNFRYSVLEVFDDRTTDTEVLNREIFYKDLLMTRKFGYNLN